MKKILSVLLCLAMLSSFAFAVTPPSSNSGDEVITSVFFASDAQFYGNITNTANYFDNTNITTCGPILDKLVGIVNNNGHDIETFVFGGDYTQNDGKRNPNDPNDIEVFGPNANSWHYGNDPKYSIAELKAAIKKHYTVSDNNIIFAQGNHEPDITATNNYGLNKTGAYEFNDYIVYVLNDQDFVGLRPRTLDLSTQDIALDKNGNQTIVQITNPTEIVQEVADELNDYLNKLISSGDSRPVFIASHQPLYSERLSDYNGNANLIFEAVNEPAKKLDIIFFFGHTHQKVDEIGGGLAYIAKGDTLKVCNNPSAKADADMSYATESINFTYMNFGHLARYSGTNPYLSATVVDITKDTLILTRYGAKNSDILGTYQLQRVNPAKAIPDKITGNIDANGEERVLANGETVTISNGGILRNAIIDANCGSVNIGNAKITGRIQFNQNGAIGVDAYDIVKISEPNNSGKFTNKFLQKAEITEGASSYTILIKNNTSNKSAEHTFTFEPIYSGNVMFNLNIENVPSDTDLTVDYK